MNCQELRPIIERIRRRCLSEFEANPELYDKIDVRRVRKDDWQIERFIIDQESEDKAFELLIKALQWKKSFGVHDRNDQYFPKEFYEFNEIEMFGHDKEGRIIHWEVSRNVVKTPDFMNLEQKFFAHRIEKLDTEGSRNGWTLIADNFGTGLANISLEMFKFKIGVFNYYPQGMRRAIIIDIHWILNPVIKVILSFLKPKVRDRVVFITRNQLPDYVDIGLIHVNLSGKRKKKVYPEGLQTMNKLSYLGFTTNQIEEYYYKHRVMPKTSH